MSYQKPQLIAKSEPKQSYVAGCPVNGRGSDAIDGGTRQPTGCRNCERTQ